MQKLTLDLTNRRRELDTKPSVDDVRSYADGAYLDLHQRLETLEHSASNSSATFEQMKQLVRDKILAIGEKDKRKGSIIVRNLPEQAAYVDIQKYREDMPVVDWEIVKVEKASTNKWPS
ncbi:hypothetical protein QYM36_019268 [Artemia franciscana]|uniref:Uncharacterized protein n=1 Tax=Artemia franciscana TaxID=6661 RepID=A0AA88H5I9_ARTSF|nr:hypothetical protein QYM36_019268 [Artemia franciscana]